MKRIAIAGEIWDENPDLQVIIDAIDSGEDIELIINSISSPLSIASIINCKSGFSSHISPAIAILFISV